MAAFTYARGWVSCAHVCVCVCVCVLGGGLGGGGGGREAEMLLLSSSPHKRATHYCVGAGGGLGGAAQIFKSKELSFEKLGIGGLDSQFDDIFRRALLRVFSHPTW